MHSRPCPGGKDKAVAGLEPAYDMRINSMDSSQVSRPSYLLYTVLAIILGIIIAYVLKGAFFSLSAAWRGIWKHKLWVLALVSGFIILKRWLGKRKKREAINEYLGP